MKNNLWWWKWMRHWLGTGWGWKKRLQRYMTKLWVCCIGSFFYCMTILWVYAYFRNDQILHFKCVQFIVNQWNLQSLLKINKTKVRGNRIITFILSRLPGSFVGCFSKWPALFRAIAVTIPLQQLGKNTHTYTHHDLFIDSSSSKCFKPRYSGSSP